MSEFCPECGSLIEYPEFTDLVECSNCPWKISLNDLNFESVVTELVFDDKKHWLEQYYQEIGGNQMMEQEHQDHRQTIQQECSKCLNNLMFFWTMQTRSADEGSTVFYECTKCKTRFSQNN